MNVDVVQTVVLALSAGVSLVSLWYVRKWNRKNATIEKLQGHEVTDSVIYLERSLEFLKRERAISMEELGAVQEKYADVDEHLLVVLSYYQALARGVEEGVYDKSMVHQYRWTSMFRAYCVLQRYIVHLRFERNRHGLYSEFEKHVKEEARDRGEYVPKI